MMSDAPKKRASTTSRASPRIRDSSVMALTSVVRANSLRPETHGPGPGCLSLRSGCSLLIGARVYPAKSAKSDI